MLVGLGGLEPPTPRLSSVCSNQLSYRPSALFYTYIESKSDLCARLLKVCDYKLYYLS